MFGHLFSQSQKEMLLVNTNRFRNQIFHDKYHSPLLSIHHLSFGNPQVIHFKQAGQFETKQMNGCAKKSKDKKCNFFFKSEMFSSNKQQYYQ